MSLRLMRLEGGVVFSGWCVRVKRRVRTGEGGVWRLAAKYWTNGDEFIILMRV